MLVTDGKPDQAKPKDQIFEDWRLAGDLENTTFSASQTYPKRRRKKEKTKKKNQSNQPSSMFPELPTNQVAHLPTKCSKVPGDRVGRQRSSNCNKNKEQEGGV